MEENEPEYEIGYIKKSMRLYQPRITRAMKGLSVEEKIYILCECMKDHQRNLKKEFVDG